MTGRTKLIIGGAVAAGALYYLYKRGAFMRRCSATNLCGGDNVCLVGGAAKHFGFFSGTCVTQKFLKEHSDLGINEDNSPDVTAEDRITSALSKLSLTDLFGKLGEFLAPAADRPHESVCDCCNNPFATCADLRDSLDCSGCS